MPSRSVRGSIFGVKQVASCANALVAQASDIQPQASSKAAYNKKARAAYKKKLAEIKQEKGFVSYRVIDLTNDGIDELIVSNWPSIYSYRGGEAVQVDYRDVGTVNYEKAYKKKKVVVYAKLDHYGSSSYGYLKWNGYKFVLVAVKYTPSASGRTSMGWTPYYWIEGKGQVSKKAVNTYVRKLVGSSKATKLGYATYKQY